MKDVRRLRKKLRQIDELIAKKEAGAVLEYSNFQILTI